jgi:urea transporter
LNEDGAVVQIYDGIWGYNSLLAMAAVSCVFFPFSPASFVAGLINTIGTVAIHAALRASMDKVDVLECRRFTGSFLSRPSNLHPFSRTMRAKYCTWISKKM